MSEPIPPMCCCCLPVRGLTMLISGIAVFGCIIQFFTDKNSDTKAIYVVSMVVQIGTFLAALQHNATFLLIVLWITGLAVFCSFAFILIVPVMLTAQVVSGYNIVNATLVHETPQETLTRAAVTGYYAEALYAILFLVSCFQFILINRVRNHFLALNRFAASSTCPIPSKKKDSIPA